jgi:glycosyltransferase involved in cell wall biosynthesis
LTAEKQVIGGDSESGEVGILGELSIVIDARRIDSSTGHYVQHLLDELQQIDQVNNYTVIVLEKEKDYWQPTSSNFRVLAVTYDHYTFGEQLGLAWTLYRLRPDLVHFTMPQQPILWVGRRVTTIHDTTLIRYDNIDQPWLLYKTRKFIFTMIMRNVIARSRVIITPTEYVRHDLDEWTRHRFTLKLQAIHEAGSMAQVEPEPIPELVGTRYLFYIGNAFPYKNVQRIVEAFGELKGKYGDLQLVLAGKKEFFYQQLENKVQKWNIADVHFLGYTSEGQKRWAFQHATAYVTATLSEGFSIQQLEAMSEDCPVISSNATCLPEVGGDAPLYFDPHSTPALVAAVRQLLDTPQLHQDMITRGRRNVARFSWQRMAEQTANIYQRILTKNP